MPKKKCLALLLLSLASLGAVGLSVGSKKPIPITVLSGFLGSGKTSLLQNLLNNDRGLRIAVIVNDVASVNIDSKLVANSQRQQQTAANSGSNNGGGGGAAGMVELQNGCACCSLSEELLGSVSELVTLSDLRGEELAFHHIVVELSGVADPKSVRAKFQEAVLYDMPLMERVCLDTMVTLVDCSVFLEYLKNAKSATPDDAPELFFRDGVKPEPSSTDEWAEDIPPLLLEALVAGQTAYGGGSSAIISGAEQDSGVADLLVSQCEIADVVLLNKVDLTTREDISLIEGIVRALNPRATVYSSEYGRVDLDNVLAVAGGKGVVEAGVVDDHKDSISAAVASSASASSHRHEHSESKQDECEDPDCTDTTHSHAHDHEGCDDPGCTDPSHSHEHGDYAHANMGTYVYRSRRPFHPGRLLSFLRHLPIARGLPPQMEGDKDDERITISRPCGDAMKNVLRSKGFIWCADSDVAAMYWSHAGTSFELSCLGRWWATLGRENWPPEIVTAILDDFDSTEHNEDDPKLATVGDRRQEIVFIGPGIGGSSNQDEISMALDQCLLTDDEWREYCVLRLDDRSLRSRFSNPIQAKVATY